VSISLFTKYCIDSSSLIDLNWRRYPQARYPDLWGAVEHVFRDDVLVAPREVRRELQNGSHGDDLKQWATDHPNFFPDPDDDQFRRVTLLLDEFPRVCDLRKRRPVDADPWVIVLAQAHGLAVVSSERSDSDKKIPYFCHQVGVPVVDIDGFFGEMGWSFSLGGGLVGAASSSASAERTTPTS